MTPKPQIQTRTRRIYRCYLHPSEPVTGFCASCLRDRLSFLDPSSNPPPSPELRRTKSVSGPSSLSSDPPRRKSCDVRAQNTLAHLFNLDDVQKNKPIKEPEVESNNIPISKLTLTRTVFDSHQNGLNVEKNDEEEEVKTMQELIDLEFLNKKKKIGEITSNFTSIFGKRLRKWNRKQKMKKPSEIGECGWFGRRSCDTDPRHSVDVGRVSFDERRASWDGYLIARTIPRLTPMLSVVDNVMLPANHGFDNRRLSLDGKMQAIHEDDMNTTSGDSSQRQSSFDRSTSSVRSKKTLGLDFEVDEMKAVMNSKVSPANDEVFGPTKLVITERELKNWGLNSLKDDHGTEKVESFSKDVIGSGDDSNGFKKSTRWRKVWGFINRFGDNKFQGFTSNVIDQSVDVSEVCEKKTEEGDTVVKGVASAKLVRSSSCVGSRNSHDIVGSYQRTENGVENCVHAKKGREEFLLERNRSAKYSSGNTDNGMLRLYLTPLQSSSRSKSGKCRLKNSNSIASNILPLN